MEQPEETRIKNRQSAGTMLAKKLAGTYMTNAVVVGIPHGGVCVASALADQLQLPLEVMPCRKVKDPSNGARNIGSVSANEVVLHDCEQSLPQDYIYFQTIRLRNEIKYENDFYYNNGAELNFEYKTVIVVDDILRSADTLIACIREIRSRRALKIIVAVPIAEAEAARIISAEADDFVCLKLKQSIGPANEYYEEFPPVKEWTVRDLLRRAKRQLVPVSA
jgi:putative phosphoribosyl transferase